MEKNSIVPKEILEYAKNLGEVGIQVAESFKTNVFVGDKLVFKLSEQGKSGQKEEFVLKLLEEKLPNNAVHLVPKFIGSKELGSLGFVGVQTKLAGDHPKEMSKELSGDLGQFLRSLHDMVDYEKIDEFEGGGQFDFKVYLSISSKKYFEKLKDNVNQNDLNLISKAIDFIEKYINNKEFDEDLVLVHKDLYLENLLVNNEGELTGVIDWGASQVAPREWEFAILRQRMPEYWENILNSYGANINHKLMDICGLVQSLRFWKSFLDDKDFVDSQRKYIRGILDASLFGI